MSKRDGSAGAKPAPGVVAGMAAGAVAAFAMDRFQALVSPLLTWSGAFVRRQVAVTLAK